MAGAPGSARDIAGAAAARCEAALRAIVQALEDENAGTALGDTYANAYGDTLRKQVIRHTAAKVAVARKR